MSKLKKAKLVTQHTHTHILLLSFFISFALQSSSPILHRTITNVLQYWIVCLERNKKVHQTMQKKKSAGQPFFSDWIVFFSNFLFINKHIHLHIPIDHHHQHQTQFPSSAIRLLFFCFSPLLQRKIENCLETCGNERKAISGEEKEGRKREHSCWLLF